MKRISKHQKVLSILLLIAVWFLLLPLNGCQSQSDGSDKASMPDSASVTDKPNIAIAWNNVESYSYTSTFAAANELDANIIKLGMLHSYDLQYDAKNQLTDAKDEHGSLTSDAAKLVKMNTWQNSDVEEAMEDIDAVIFPGGSDISPTLYYSEQTWHGIEADTDYCAERDVSDYILMNYCLEKDIPVLAICRGMQMLSVVSGADIIQDIGTWYADQDITYHDEHRDPNKKDLIPHSVQITDKDSLLYQITGQTELNGCPSWHHQAVGSVEHTRLTVTAQTTTDGREIIEAVERRDKTFCIGLQFHPEVAVRKILDQEANADEFMSYDMAMSFFTALEAAA